MIRQSTRGPVKSSAALMLVAVCVLGLIAADKLLGFLARRGLIGNTMGAVIIWAFVIAMFWFVLKRYCLASVYELDGVKLVFSRIYFRRPRPEEVVFLREAVYFGDADKCRHAVSSTRRFTSDRSGYAVQALVYRRENKYCRILFNPNEEIFARLREKLK